MTQLYHETKQVGATRLTVVAVRYEAGPSHPIVEGVLLYDEPDGDPIYHDLWLARGIRNATREAIALLDGEAQRRVSFPQARAAVEG